MKCSAGLMFLLLGALLVTLVCASPVGDHEQNDLIERDIVRSDEKTADRQKRFTCDVLSISAFGVSLNHAACAAHCLYLGRRGGYCNSQRVCICRN